MRAKNYRMSPFKQPIQKLNDKGQKRLEKTLPRVSMPTIRKFGTTSATNPSEEGNTRPCTSRWRYKWEKHHIRQTEGRGTVQFLQYCPPGHTHTGQEILYELAENCEHLKSKNKDDAPSTKDLQSTRAAWTAKDVMDETSAQLETIFMQSMKEGKTPQKWKTWEISAIIKKGSWRHAGNYRPLILMSIVGKIMESLIWRKSSNT